MTNHRRWFKYEEAVILRRRRMLQLMAAGAVLGQMTPVKKEGLSPTKVFVDEPFTEEVLVRGGNRTGLTNLNAVNLAVVMRGDNW